MLTKFGIKPLPTKTTTPPKPMGHFGQPRAQFNRAPTPIIHHDIHHFVPMSVCDNGVSDLLEAELMIELAAEIFQPVVVVEEVYYAPAEVEVVYVPVETYYTPVEAPVESYNDPVEYTSSDNGSSCGSSDE